MDKLSALGLLSCFCLGCDPGVETTIVPTGELFSVNCFISPQDTAHIAWVYRAAAIGEAADTENLVVRNALVVISDGVSKDTLTIAGQDEYYFATHKHLVIEELRTYNLLVEVPGKPPITGYCTVPATPLTPMITGSRNGDDYDFSMAWTNPSGHKFYVASAEAHGFYLLSSPLGNFKAPLGADLDQRQYPTTPQPPVGQVNGVIVRAYRADEASLTASIWNVDQDFYDYYRTLDNYDVWIVSAHDPIPLFNQPKAIYTNLNGAVGIFASFNRSFTDQVIK